MLDLTRMESHGALELKKGGCYGIEDETLVFMLSPAMLQ